MRKVPVVFAEMGVMSPYLKSNVTYSESLSPPALTALAIVTLK